MPIFPKPQPNEPRILRAMKTPEDRRLAIAVLCYGTDDIPQLAMYTKSSEECIKNKLKSTEFQTYISHLKDHPNEVLPTQAEIMARLIIEMEKGDRSTDRQRAAEMLMELQGSKKEGVLDKFRRKDSAAG